MLYGHKIQFSLSERGFFTPTPFLAQIGDTNSMSSTALKEFQEAANCCSDNLPSRPKFDEVWVCDVCTRVWVVPVADAPNWTLTKLSPVPRAERVALASTAYNRFIAAIISIGLSALVVVAALVVILGFHIRDSSNIYISFAAFVVGCAFSAFMITRWTKAKNRYALTVPDDGIAPAFKS